MLVRSGLVLALLLIRLARSCSRAPAPAVLLLVLAPAAALAQSGDAAREVETALTLGDCEAARRAATRLTRAAPEEAEGWRLTGDAARCSSATRAAVEAYQRYFALGGDDPGVRELVDALSATLGSMRIRLVLPPQAAEVEVRLMMDGALFEPTDLGGGLLGFEDLPVGAVGSATARGRGFVALRQGVPKLGAGELLELDLEPTWVGLGRIRVKDFDSSKLRVTLVTPDSQVRAVPEQVLEVTAGRTRVYVATDQGEREAALDVTRDDRVDLDPAAWLPASLTLVQIPAGSTVRLSVESAAGEVVEREEIFEAGQGTIDPDTGVRVAPPRRVISLIGGTGGLFVSHPLLGNSAASFAVQTGVVNATTFDWRSMPGLPVIQEAFDRWMLRNDPVAAQARQTRGLGVTSAILAATAGGLLVAAAAANAEAASASAQALMLQESGGDPNAHRNLVAEAGSALRTRNTLLVVGGVTGGLSVTGLTFTIVSAAHHPELDLSDWDRDLADP